MQKQEVTNDVTGETETFPINEYKKECFLKGFDDIDYLLDHKDQIEEFEAKAAGKF